MRRKLAALLMLTLAGGLFVGIRAAEAHQCPDGTQPNDPNCQETGVYRDWRDNYVPLFDLSDRDGEDGEQQRYDAQRWRDECNSRNQYDQQCQWSRGGQSLSPSETDAEGSLPRPNEWHVGYAANHCFLAEAAHDCDGHANDEFGTHDSHGGAVYVDICLATNPDSKYCDEGLKDTQAGVTIVDHLTCPMGCFDEYHVVRPLDTEYTEQQMANSQTALEGIVTDPQRHVCGYEDNGSPGDGSACYTQPEE